MTDQALPPLPPEAQQRFSVEPLSLIQPVPVQPLTGVANGPDGNLVIDRYETATGSFLFFLTPEQAKAHGEDLIRRAASATSGLVLPPNTRL